jgi:hypothetical protein
MSLPGAGNARDVPFIPSADGGKDFAPGLPYLDRT